MQALFPTIGQCASRQVHAHDARSLDEAAPTYSSHGCAHVNFWATEEKEAGAKDPQAEAAKMEEVKRRGDPARQTSDARFDESFRLANGLQQAANQVPRLISTNPFLLTYFSLSFLPFPYPYPNHLPLPEYPALLPEALM